MSQTRRLAAILAADVAGYSRLMGADEEGTLERLKALRRELLDPKIAEHQGRIVKTTGDGLLVEFASVVDAVRCAVAVQQAMPERNAGVAADNRIELRIGINLGDVIVEGDDLYGDGVNIAARIEALADAGGVFVSNTVHDHVRDRLPFVFEDLGEQQVKNIARPVRVYRVRDAHPSPRKSPSVAELPASVLPLPDKPSIAVLPFANMSGDPEQEYFADGMVEEIITALSRIRWLFVIARNSTFTYKGQAVDVKQVGRELGVRYVLEGSVRKAGNRVRITAQLIDAADRHASLGRSLRRLARRRVRPSGQGGDQRRRRHRADLASGRDPPLRRQRPTSDLTAYDLYLRALPLWVRHEKSEFEALDLLEQAIATRSAALRAGARLGGATADMRSTQRLGRDPRDDPPQGHRSCSAGARGGADDPEHPRQGRHRARRISARTSVRHRAGRPCAGAQPELRPRLVLSGLLRLCAGATRSRDRACRDLAAPEPTRALRVPFPRDGQGLFLQTSVRRSGGEAALAHCKTIPVCVPTHTAFSPRAMPIWDGSTKRVRSSLGCAPSPLVVAERVTHPRNPEHRELFLSGLRLAAGEADMSQTRRLAAILAADVAGYSRLMGADEEGTLERLKALRRELVDPKIAEHHG